MTDRLADAVQGLTRQERLGFKMSRRFPKMTGRANRLVYQVTNGHLGGSNRGIPIGLLTVKGRRSGKDRTVPLMYLDDGSRFLDVASNGGLDCPPAWYLNLQHNRAATFRTRAGEVKVTARDLLGSDRSEVWPRLLELNPLWGAFQSCTDRENVVVALERSG